MREGPLKAAAFRTLAASGLLRLAETWGRGATILAYHGVTGRADRPLANLRRLHVPAARFAEHLDLLRRVGPPLPLREVAAALSAGRRPPRGVVLTIDDGYRNVLTQALPLLRERAFPATVFVVTGEAGGRPWIDRMEALVARTAAPHLEWEDLQLHLGSAEARRQAMRILASRLEGLGPEGRADALEALGRGPGDAGAVADEDRDLLGWDEVRALRDGGLEIGSHAHHHEPLTRAAPDRVFAELLDSRQALERELGRGPYAVSYPYGAWSPQVGRAAREAGFYCAVTGDPGRNGPGSDVFGLRRMLVGADDDLTRLRASVAGLRAGRRRRTPPSGA
jgi:peptidoglycan/xylan/chitin deacetylase (PgdA/CDA1 family)